MSGKDTMDKRNELIREITVTVGNEPIQIFMQHHFWNSEYMSSSLHKHKFAEVHIVLEGQIEYQACGECVMLLPGDMVVIPQETMHCSQDPICHARRITFQLTKQIRQFRVVHPGTHITSMLEDKIALYLNTGETAQLGACLTLICSMLPGINGYPITPVQNFNYLIDHFISRNYNKNITLQDMADELNMSKQHTLRLIQKYTGHSFRAELRNRRLESSKYLMEHTTLSLEQIAEKVGYKSYNGLWKALNQDKTEHSD